MSTAAGGAIGPKRFSVEKQFGVEFPRSPTVQDGPHSRLVDAQQIGGTGEVRRERDDRAHIQIAICPGIQTVPDAGGKGIINS